jgi:hypothetical protein
MLTMTAGRSTGAAAAAGTPASATLAIMPPAIEVRTV